MDQIPPHPKVLFSHPLCFDTVTTIIAAIFFIIIIKQEVNHGDAKQLNAVSK